jgi:hypothetical protein
MILSKDSNYMGEDNSRRKRKRRKRKRRKRKRRKRKRRKRNNPSISCSLYCRRIFFPCQGIFSSLFCLLRSSISQ